MTIDFAAVWAWCTANWEALRLTGGGLLALILLLALWRKTRHHKLSTIAGSIAAPLVLLWEAQGVYELAVKMRMPHVMALLVSGVGAAVLVTIAARAHEHWLLHGNLGPNGRLLWRIAVPMGIVVALSATSLAEAGGRLLLPVLAATVVMSRYLPDEPDGKPSRSNEAGGSWRWTPRRIGISLGWIVPDDADLATVHEEHRVRQLTTVRLKLEHTTPGTVTYRRRQSKLDKLALLATDAMTREVATRISRVHHFVALTAPAATAAPHSRHDGDSGTPDPRHDGDNFAPRSRHNGDSNRPGNSGDTGSGEPQPRAPRYRPARDTAEKVERALKRYPHASAEEIAQRLNVSKRTVQRYHPERSSTA
jgi:hypothetical protein